MTVLKLGCADQGAVPSNLSDFFSTYHESFNMKNQFRGDGNGRWRDFVEVDGGAVADLQTRLRKFGFLANGDMDGIFGYRTQSAVRLFQEYVRTVENDPGIGVPDGIVGPNTFQHLDRWHTAGLTADWDGFSRAPYDRWMGLLRTLKNHCRQHPGPLLQKVQAFQGATDTRKVADWDVSPDHIHLIGIRRGADAAWKTRINNDVFVLLVKGLVFMFFGSTDPTPRGTRKERPPFLVPGQHLYRFGWHKVGSPEKVYRAFRPARYGVLILRDRPGSLPDALDETDLATGVLESNRTINIHWSGKHTGNWSAGCQVIAGGGYINHHDALVDCWKHAAATYTQLPQLTRGAYNLLLDLVTVFLHDASVAEGDLLHYMLVDENDPALAPSLGASAARDILRRGLEILAVNDRQKYDQYQSLLA